MSTDLVARVSFQGYLKSLQSLYGVAGAGGAIIPAAAIFLDLAPPLVPILSGFVSALSAAALIATYFYQPKGPSQPKRRPRRRTRLSVSPVVRRAVQFLVTALLLICLYSGMIAFFTVSEEGERFQIGIYKASWSLTEEGMSVKSTHPNETPKEWMRDDALFTQDGPEKLWTQWSRVFAFTLMFIVYACAFVAWSIAWGLLAKEHAATQPTTPN